MFLTRSEIEELTGYKTPATQTRWLQDNGFLFKIGADGYPRLLLTEVEYHMSHSVSDKKITKKEPKVVAKKAEEKPAVVEVAVEEKEIKNDDRRKSS